MLIWRVVSGARAVPGEDALAVREGHGARLGEDEELGDRARRAVDRQAAAQVGQHHGGGVQQHWRLAADFNCDLPLLQAAAGDRAIEHEHTAVCLQLRLVCQH